MKKRRWYYMMIGLVGIWVILIQEFLMIPRVRVPDEEREQHIEFIKNDLENEPDFSLWYENLGVVRTDISFADVMDSPSSEGICIGKMLPGTGIDILSMENGFVRFEQNGTACWIHSEYLLTGEKAAKTAKDEAIYCGTLVENVEILDAPSKNSTVVHRLVAGDCYPITEENDQWVRLEIRGDFGGYVEKEKMVCGYKLAEPIVFANHTGTRINLLNMAWNYYGGKYVWGGTTLGVGVDCSGFMLRLYEMFDVKLPRVSYEQATAGVEIRFEEIQPGDLIFYSVHGERVDHVAMYTGNHKIIHAASEASGICVNNWDYLPVVCIRRFL